MGTVITIVSFAVILLLGYFIAKTAKQRFDKENNNK